MYLGDGETSGATLIEELLPADDVAFGCHLRPPHPFVPSGGDSKLRPNRLRLIYLGDGETGGATLIEELLPADDVAYALQLDEVQRECVATWQAIAELVQGNDPLAFQPCGKKYCFCHQARPAVFGGR
jgi:hypothetical protein